MQRCCGAFCMNFDGYSNLEPRMLASFDQGATSQSNPTTVRKSLILEMSGSQIPLELLRQYPNARLPCENRVSKFQK